MERQIRRLAATALVVLLCVALPATAGVLDGTGAYNDGGTTWHGSVDLVGAMINATVVYTVYAPGVFDTVYTSYTDPDPTGGTEVIYAYEVTNNSGFLPLLKLSIGLDGDEPLTDPSPTWPLAYVGFLDGTGVNPSAGFVSTGQQSVRWDLGAGLGPAAVSDILFYASPTLPEMGNVTVDYAYAQTGTKLDVVPNPGLEYVPEPLTGTLLAIGGLWCLRRRRATVR